MKTSSPWFSRPEFDPEAKIPFWAGADGTVRLEVRDTEGRVLRRLDEMEVVKGVSTYTWDLKLDEELALAAEQAELAKAEEEKAAAAKKKKRGKKEDKPEASDKGVLAKTPWAERVRLGRPLYVTPGKYKIALIAGDQTAETELRTAITGSGFR